MFTLPRRMLEESFGRLRSCGANRHECQLYWLSPWDNPYRLTEVVHPKHRAGRNGLSVDSEWIGQFWNDLAARNYGVRIQVHTHPRQAFHSATDDAFPLLFDAGFLSLVIPNFAFGSVGFEDAYLAEIQPSGEWREVAISSRILIDETC